MTVLLEKVKKLIEFHELAEVDSMAAEILEEISVFQENTAVDTEFSDHLEQIRQENISPLAP
jgi:hypothetical protein